MTSLQDEALAYHQRNPKGKIEVRATKPTATQHDLTLAYSPGVAAPCREIARDPALAYEYTAKGNLVGVISNGSAVLGLGNIGALAGKPVMEGKGVLFKKFADLDVFDLEVAEADAERFVAVVQALEPTFGGINLEDIKAPECFYIETELQKRMNIPVFHDDQHGTAIITSAALLNALEFAKKDIGKIRVVVSGAGAAALGCVRLYLELGVKREHITLTDIHGVVYLGRDVEMDEHKGAFAQDTSARTLAEAIQGADMFLGLSAPNVLTPEMLQSMARDPIVFALANPDPEIAYETAREARPDAILATGRSDYPNQVNNVLCFPYIFRGALDVRATEINLAMKLAAARALAELVKDDTPDEVLIAYGRRSLHYGREYLIPTPFDPRLLRTISQAVAEAAIATGVARLTDFKADAYRDNLAAKQSVFLSTSRQIVRQARDMPSRRIVFPEGLNETILRACHQITVMNLAMPVLVGDEPEIRQRAEAYHVSLDGVEIVDNRRSTLRETYADRLFELRGRKGMMRSWADLLMERPVVFALMMMELGHADGFVGGITRSYPEIIRPALEIIGTRPDMPTVAGMYMMLYRDSTLFLADTTVSQEPSAELLADIAIHTAQAARFFGVTPRVAMLSYSNFGSVRNADLARLTKAIDIVREREPDLMIDGEMQGHLAINAAERERNYPFSTLKGQANVLVFPNLHAANTSYRLLSELSEGEIIGPILMGMNKPINVLSQEALVQDVVNMTAISVLEYQRGVI